MITTVYIARINGIMGGIWQEKTVHADIGVDLAYAAGRKPARYGLPVPRDLRYFHTHGWSDQDFARAMEYIDRLNEDYWGTY